MPSRSLPSPPAGLTRRTAITTFAIGFGSLWAGCTNERDPRGPSPQGAGAEEHPDKPDPDAAVASMALANEQSTLDALEATAGRHRELAELLSPAIAAHTEHVRLLADAAPPGPAASTSISPSPDNASSDPGEQDTRRYRVPRTPQAALIALSTNEHGLSTSNKRHAFVAQSGAFARLLASMAGSAAQHAEVLGRSLPTKSAGR